MFTSFTFFKSEKEAHSKINSANDNKLYKIEQFAENKPLWRRTNKILSCFCKDINVVQSFVAKFHFLFSIFLTICSKVTVFLLNIFFRSFDSVLDINLSFFSFSAILVFLLWEEILNNVYLQARNDISIYSFCTSDWVYFGRISHYHTSIWSLTRPMIWVLFLANVLVVASIATLSLIYYHSSFNGKEFIFNKRYLLCLSKCSKFIWIFLWSISEN